MISLFGTHFHRVLLTKVFALQHVIKNNDRTISYRSEECNAVAMLARTLFTSLLQSSQREIDVLFLLDPIYGRSRPSEK